MRATLSSPSTAIAIHPPRAPIEEPPQTFESLMLDALEGDEEAQHMVATLVQMPVRMIFPRCGGCLETPR